MAFVSYKVENDKKLQDALDKAFVEVRDLRVPFRQITRDFYQSRKAIFKLQSNGQYPDFKGKKIGETWSKNARPSDIARRKRPQGATPYEWYKFNAVGFTYPLLKFSGRLEDSATNPNSPDAEQIIEPDSLTIITKVPYANFHQQDNPDMGDRKIPTRKFFFIGGESSTTDRQLERYLKIISDYVNKSLKAKK